jgi:hypothetical protein
MGSWVLFVLLCLWVTSRVLRGLPPEQRPGCLILIVVIVLGGFLVT